MINLKKILKIVFFALVILLTAVSCKQNKEECTPKKQVSYEQDIAPIIKTECFECHAPDKYKQKASRVRIFNYKFLKEYAENGVLLGALTHQKGYIPMPYKKGTKIASCSIEMIAQWINTGMKK